MSATAGDTLEELAEAFGLTARTARHYIEHVLPPHHKTGRGKRARYAEDTRLCFAFIRQARADKLTLAQISRLLAELSTAQIAKVAHGQEELSIVPAERPEPGEFFSSPCMAGDFAEPPDTAQAAGDIPRWQVLYSDDELQITRKGEASPEQRAQVRMAATWIKRLFERS